MSKDNIKKEYFEREENPSTFNQDRKLDYTFFAQEDNQVELEIDPDSH